MVSYIRMGRRFPDAPLLAAVTFPGLVYLGANAVISAAVYVVLTVPGRFISEVSPISNSGPGLIALSGIAAPLILQSQLASIRIGQLQIDPGYLLNDFFNQIHGAVDRCRARQRLSSVALTGLEFDRDCIPLAELVSNALRLPDPNRDAPAELGLRMGELGARDDLPDGVKLQFLEAELVKLAGPRVVRIAARVLRRMRDEECRSKRGTG
jgi:hypothetical protein